MTSSLKDHLASIRRSLDAWEAWVKGQHPDSLAAAVARAFIADMKAALMEEA